MMAAVAVAVAAAAAATHVGRARVAQAVAQTKHVICINQFDSYIFGSLKGFYCLFTF